MSNYSAPIFRWLPEAQWHRWICCDIKAILACLAEQGVSILRVGEENYKSPAGVIFTDKPFSAPSVLAKLPDAVALNVKGVDNGIMCIAHYVVIVYEQDIEKNR